MKKVGIVICNFNKKDYVEKCIGSLQKQSVNNFDIYVVDNASTDGSVEYLIEKFGKYIAIICNDENLGGSGGFNTGIKKVMEKKYSFIMLLDNDVILSENCVEQCISLMEKNHSIGMLGCEILKMDDPDRIQEFGPVINYDTMNFELSHGGEVDNGQLPELCECDYVPACAMMVRREVIELIGLMPQENFIYYDDITWGVRCHRAGYKVMVTSLAKAWHKGGAAVNPTTFASYYLNRNKLRFFMRYMKTICVDSDISDAEIIRRSENILKDIFEGIYSCNKNGLPNVSKTRMEAFLDAINDVTGKVEGYKIRNREIPNNKLIDFVLNKNKIHICMHGLWESTRRIVNWLFELQNQYDTKFEIIVSDDTGKYDGCNILGIKILDYSSVIEKDFVELNICKHIYETIILDSNRVWIDGWRNAVIDEIDLANQQAFQDSYELFKLCFIDTIVEKIKENLKND